MSTLIVPNLSAMYNNKYKLLRDGNLTGTMNDNWDGLEARTTYLALPNAELCSDKDEFLSYFGSLNLVELEYPGTLREQRQFLLNNKYNKRIISNFSYVLNYLPGVVSPPYSLFANCSRLPNATQPCDEFQEQLEIAAMLAEEVFVNDEEQIAYLPSAKVHNSKPAAGYYNQLKIKPTGEYLAIIPFRLGASDYDASLALEIASVLPGKVLVCGAKDFYNTSNLPANCELKLDMQRIDFLNAFCGAEYLIAPRHIKKFHYVFSEAKHFNVKIVESMEDLG